MLRRRLRLLIAPIAAILPLAGCGDSGVGKIENLSGVPLAGGARIVAEVRQCDRGVNAYCALEFVVVDPLYPTSTALQASEHRRLRQRGWTSANGDIGNEQAANSPDHKLRMTYAAAQVDLQGIDLGYIRRSRTISLALSRTMFDRSSAISVMLEAGPA